MAELTSVSLVQSYLGNSSASSTILTGMIAAAERQIARLCNRYTTSGNFWLNAAHTEYLDGEFGQYVNLHFYPVTAISSVDIITSASASQSVTLTDLECDGIALTDLSASNSAVIGRLGYRAALFNAPTAYDMGYTPQLTNPWYSTVWPNFAGGRKRVKVVYTGGFTAAPDDLVQAATQLVAKMFLGRLRDPNVEAQTLGKFSVKYIGPGEDPFAIGDIRPMIESYVRATF